MFRGEAGGDPPHLLQLLARGKSEAKTGLEEVRNLPRRALVERGIQDVRYRRGRKWGFQPWHGGYRGLVSEVRLAEENVFEAYVRPQCRLEAHQEVVDHGV